MAKIKVAVFDADRQYRERFAAYLMSYKSQEIDLAVYSGITYFLEALEVENYHLLVLGCGYEEILPRVRARQTPVLVLSNPDFVRESFGIDDAQVSYVPKYQSMDVITHQMYLMTEARRSLREVDIGMETLSVVGIFSPVRHEMQMFFSLLYAQNEQIRGKVLYLNLMEFSGFCGLFGEEQYDLGDLIIQIREEKIKKESVLACIYEGEKFSYVQPFCNPESVKELTGKDVKRLLEFVAEQTDFQTVVIDFGGMMEGFHELVSCCTKIYCVSRNGQFYENVVQQFLNYLKTITSEDLVSGVKIVELPNFTKSMGGGMNLLEQLQWSEFGDCVRGI